MSGMAVDALIFDDAPYFSGFLQAILEELKLSVKVYPDGRGALEHIRREKPNVVFLDVMMPGMDGLSLCKEIKADQALARMKVVIVTGKVFMDDQARAAWANADLYVQKPFNVEEFSAQIQKLLAGFKRRGAPPPDAGAPVPAEAKETFSVKPAAAIAPAPWRIRFWGTGPDSDCMSFVDRDRLIVVDAGSGLEALAGGGVETGVKDVWLLLTHFHQDHVKGLAHAQSWIRAGLRVHVVGPAETESFLPRLVERALPAASVDVHSLWEGDFDGIAGLPVKAAYTMHPGACFAYRLGIPGKSVVFAPDSEIPPVSRKSAADNTEKLGVFSLGADLLVHDARYSNEDYPQFEGRGHSCPQAALDLALRARAGSLVLCHLDAKYSAADRERIMAEVKSAPAPRLPPSARLLARNGLELYI